MRDLGAVTLSVRDIPIATLAEIQTLAYEVPERLSPPGLISSWLAGSDVDPRDLHFALDNQARQVLVDSDAGLEVVRALLERLEAAFPELTA